MDWLGRNITDCLTTMQLSSVAEQLGKNLVLAETFALCGHNVSFAELKGIYEWQMVHGINLLCQHLEGYSIRGMRKRDYPPAMYYQQPWWDEYEKFVDSMSRQGMVLSGGRKSARVLLLHPQTTAWALYDDNKNIGITELNDKFCETIKALEAKHIQFHLGDEILIERHGKVVDGKIIIGTQEYDTVINTCCEVFLPSTEKILEEFILQGGCVLDSLNGFKTNNVVNDESITYTKREYNDFAVHYFVNTSPDRKKAKINVSGKALDIYTGDLKKFCNMYEFEPWGSLMIIDDGTENVSTDCTKETLVHFEGDFKITKPVINSLTLDHCDYYFDGVLQEKDGYVLNICERANALERPVKIHQDYHVKLNFIPNKLELVCETPEIFKISINGVKIRDDVNGYFRDKSFKTIDISQYVKLGNNLISFDCDFAQSEGTYLGIRNGFVFESEKNKLAYETEIEAIYLIGDFTVKTAGEWTRLDKNAVRYKGGFEIDKPKSKISLKNIEKQGFPFFSGEIELEGIIDIVDKNSTLELDIKGVNVVKVNIGDLEKVMITDNKLNLAQFGVIGRVPVKITLINNLRNLLGPHHLKVGETYWAAPTQFFKEACVWSPNPEKTWDDDYCFVETGI